MKRNRITRRLLALALTLGMALPLTPSLALPARAAAGSSPQIIIKSNKFVSTPDDGADTPTPELATRFWAYQIFIGEIDEEDYVENRDINKLNGKKLGDGEKEAIQWGVSVIHQDELLKALGDDETPARNLGVTFALMLAAERAYLSAKGLEEYERLYNNANPGEIWIDPDAEKTEQNLTGEGKARLEAAFTQALYAEENFLTIGALFNAAYRMNEEAGILVHGAATAAKVIADFTPALGNVALTQAFYAIVFDKYSFSDNPPDDLKPGDYKYLLNTGGPANGAPEDNSDNKYEGAYAVSRWVEGANGALGYWAIGTMSDVNGDGKKERELPDGYYMIRDVYDEKDKNGKASAAYMAGVYGYGTIDPKAEAPSVTKTIDGSGSGASREMGDTITFTLMGTLPKNYFTAYKGYPYIFEDTMGAGLTFGDVIRVYVKVPDANGEFGSLGAEYDYYLVEATGAMGGNTGQGYRLKKPDESNSNTLTISFPDLQWVNGKKVLKEDWTTEERPVKIPVSNDSEVYVVYTAKLNERSNITDITVDNTGNQNTVVLRYANEPLWDPEALYDNGSWDNNWADAPMGRATKKVFLYDFGVQLTVYGKTPAGETETPAGDPEAGATPAVDPEASAAPAGGTEGRKPLPGAGFALEKGSEYAVFHKTGDTYYLAGWVPQADWYAYLAGEDTGTRAARSWGAPLEAGAKIGGFTVPAAEGEYYAAVVTDENGVVRIVGLGNTPYVLEEVITPEGSATVEPVTVSFAATHDTSTGMLAGLTATADGSAIEDPGVQDILSDGNLLYDELVARLIINTESTIEVDTGGMGTALFYIGGGALLAGAALILIVSNAKSRRPEKRGQ